MRVQIVFLHEFYDHHLRQHRGLQIRRLFGGGELPDDIGVRAYVTYPQAGREDLGEGAEICHKPFGIQTFDRRKHVAVEPQFAVRIVLRREHAVFFDNLVKCAPFFKRHRDPGGVVGGGDRIYESRFRVLCQQPVERCKVHAVFFQRNADQLRAAAAEGVEGADKRGFLYQYGIALVHKDLRQHLQPLLRAGGHQQLVFRALDLLRLSQPPPDQREQRGISCGFAVLQGGDGVFADGVLRRLRKRSGREQPGVRIAAGKGDHRGVHAEGKHIGQRRGIDLPHSVGKVHNVNLLLMDQPIRSVYGTEESFNAYQFDMIYYKQPYPICQ